MDPRVARSRTAVIAATLDLLAERGITATTIEAVAERSGVAKTTIYRQWDRQPELVLDAIGTTVLVARSVGRVVEPVDDGGAEAVEGREVLGAESVDEGLADGGDVAGGGRLDGSQAFRCQHDVHTASFRAAFAAY